jgi:hypothetical protein
VENKGKKKKKKKKKEPHELLPYVFTLRNMAVWNFGSTG